MKTTTTDCPTCDNPAVYGSAPGRGFHRGDCPVPDAMIRRPPTGLLARAWWALSGQRYIDRLLAEQDLATKGAGA